MDNRTIDEVRKNEDKLINEIVGVPCKILVMFSSWVNYI